MQRLIWPGWCGLSLCPEPLPPRLEALEPHRLARLDPLAAEALAPGSTAGLAVLAPRGPGVAAGRWSLGLEAGRGVAVLEAVELLPPGVYAALRLPGAALQSPGAAARRLSRLTRVRLEEALRIVNEALSRLRILSLAQLWAIEAPVKPSLEYLMERLVNPPLGFELRPLRLVVSNPAPPGPDSLDPLEEARRLGLAAAPASPRSGEGPVLRAVLPRSLKKGLIERLLEAAEQGWAPFHSVSLDWLPRDPMLVEAVLPRGCGRCVAETMALLEAGPGSTAFLHSTQSPEAAIV